MSAGSRPWLQEKQKRRIPPAEEYAVFSIGQYHDHRDVPVRFLLVFFALFAFFVFSALFLLFVLGDDAPDTL